MMWVVMTTDKPKEFWISKGNSKFCSDLFYDYESDSYVKCSPDGFYDVISEKDTIEGGIHVIEHSAYQALKEENERLREALQWALNGNTGLSSKHLVATHFNMDAEFYAPCDKGDRRRCIGAIKAISGLEDTLDIMKNKVKWAEQVPLIIEEMKG